MNDSFTEIAARPNYPGKARDLRIAMAWLKHESPKHNPNDCQRKRSLGQLAKSVAVALLIIGLAALTVWYFGYLMYEALQ